MEARVSALEALLGNDGARGRESATDPRNGEGRPGERRDRVRTSVERLKPAQARDGEGAAQPRRLAKWPRLARGVQERE